MSPSAWKRLVAVSGVGLVLASPRVAHAGKSCVEVSDVVGQQRCSRYGDYWSLESSIPMVVSIGLKTQWIPISGHDFSATQTKHGPVVYTVDGAALGRDRVVTSGFGYQITGYVFHNLYVGIESYWSFGKIPDYSFRTGGFDVASSSAVLDTFSFDGGLLVGARIPLGKLSLRPEILLGGRVVSISQLASEDGGEAKTSTLTRGMWVAEPRLVLDLWVFPHLSVSAFGGFDLVDTRHRSLGLMLVGHARSYDGAFSL